MDMLLYYTSCMHTFLFASGSEGFVCLTLNECTDLYGHANCHTQIGA
uniref:Uncharacterized protein n=1 Tax=Arundo donax TaxID=35708 RepID=A0A0A9FRC4_ARUDO